MSLKLYSDLIKQAIKDKNERIIQSVKSTVSEKEFKDCIPKIKINDINSTFILDNMDLFIDAILKEKNWIDTLIEVLSESKSQVTEEGQNIVEVTRHEFPKNLLSDYASYESNDYFLKLEKLLVSSYKKLSTGNARKVLKKIITEFMDKHIKGINFTFLMYRSCYTSRPLTEDLEVDVHSNLTYTKDQLQGRSLAGRHADFIAKYFFIPTDRSRGERTWSFKPCLGRQRENMDI